MRARPRGIQILSVLAAVTGALWMAKGGLALANSDVLSEPAFGITRTNQPLALAAVALGALQILGAYAALLGGPSGRLGLPMVWGLALIWVAANAIFTRELNVIDFAFAAALIAGIVYLTRRPLDAHFGPAQPPSNFAARKLDAFLPFVAIAGVVTILGATGFGILYLLRDVAIFAEAYRLLVALPPSFAKTMSILTVLLILAGGVITPIALYETRAQRAFAKLEANMRRNHPEAAFSDYEGVEGRGVALDGPAGRILVLHGEGGVGEPRVVLPNAPAPPASTPTQ